MECELESDLIYKFDEDPNGRKVLDLQGEIGVITFYELDELYGNYESQYGFNMNVYAIP